MPEQTESEKTQVVTDAIRSTAFMYGKGKAIQCNLCDEWIYNADGRSASAEYDVLTTHLVENHPEIHDEVVERYQTGGRQY